MHIPDPFQELLSCHGRIRFRLELVDRLVEQLPDQPSADEFEAAVSDIMEFFSSSLVRHTRDEEEIVFPVLEARLDPALVQEMHREHAVADDLVEKARTAWQALLQGPDDRERRLQLRDAFDGLRTCYRAHMEHEERDLFPVAETLVTGEDRERLGQALIQSRAQRMVVRRSSPRD